MSQAFRYRTAAGTGTFEINVGALDAAGSPAAAKRIRDTMTAIAQEAADGSHAVVPTCRRRCRD